MSTRRNVQEPICTDNGGHGMQYNHPAFGQIGAYHTSGRAVLYGSDFVHQHYVTVRIARSTLNRNLSRDRYFGGQEVVEVAMSEAQWATFVATPNQGSGVPCTLSRIQGETMPELPDPPAVHSSYKAEAKDAVAQVERELRDLREHLARDLKGLSGKAQSAALGHVDAALRAISSSLPFIAESMGEFMEGVVEKAKIEVDAYVSQTIHRAGLTALGGSVPPLSLTHDAGSDQ